MRRNRRSLEIALIGVVMGCCLPHKVYGEELLMALRLNGETVSEGEIVTLDGSTVSLPLELLHRLRLRLPETKPDVTLIALDQLPNIHSHVDRQALVVDIDAAPDQFETSVLQNYVATRPSDRPEHPGAFLNYNLLAEDDGSTQLSSGLFSFGAFSDLGVMDSDIVASNEQGVVRLRNYLTQDNGPGHDTLVFGDTFLPSGAVGEAFPFAGVQVSSRRSLNDIQHIPAETMLGQATVPSTVDVYVNNALQSHQSVPTGPFVLENIPVATGDGNIRVVVRDALGQEQVLVKSFYTSTSVLPEGEGDYTYQTGMLRRNYGATSFDYAEPFMSGTQRYGLTDWYTTELHGEASTDRQVLAEQNSFLVAPYGTVRIGGAVSEHDGETGVLALAGAQTDTRPFSVGISGEIETPHFTELGYTGDRTTEQQAQLQMNYDLDENGSLSASLIHFKLLDQPANHSLALSYSVNFPNIGFLGLSAFNSFDKGGTSVLLSFSTSFGDRGTLSSQVTHDLNGWGASAQAIENVPTSGGFGYRTLADENAMLQREEAGFSYLSNAGEISVDGGMLNNESIGRLGMTGSIGLFDGQAFAARQTDGNFAVVDTGVGGVHIMADRQPVGVTDEDGTLVVPHLRPNEINRISIDPADIPLNVTVPDTEKVVVPRPQTGYVVDFGMKTISSATATIVAENGNFIPAGTSAKNVKTGGKSIIGNDGLIYLTDLSGGDKFEVALPNAACTFEVALPDRKAVQPDLGKLTCRS